MYSYAFQASSALSQRRALGETHANGYSAKSQQLTRDILCVHAFVGSLYFSAKSQQLTRDVLCIHAFVRSLYFSRRRCRWWRQITPSATRSSSRRRTCLARTCCWRPPRSPRSSCSSTSAPTRCTARVRRAAVVSGEAVCWLWLWLWLAPSARDSPPHPPPQTHLRTCAHTTFVVARHAHLSLPWHDTRI